MILTWLLPSDKKEKPTWAQAERKSVLLCSPIAKLISVVALGLCATQKSFSSPSQELLFIPQCSPWAELPKWCYYRESRERGKWAAWVGRRNTREKASRIRGRKTRQREKRQWSHHPYKVKHNRNNFVIKKLRTGKLDSVTCLKEK